MTIWKLYHLFFYGGTLLSFSIYAIISIVGYFYIGIVIGGIGIIISIILSLSLSCPKCKTKLNSSVNLFSKYYKGSIYIPKKCVNCGFDLNISKDLI